MKKLFLLLVVTVFVAWTAHLLISSKTPQVPGSARTGPGLSPVGDPKSFTGVTPGSSVPNVSDAHVSAPPALLSAGDPVAAFQQWSEEFLKASPAERIVMSETGRELARARRPVFKQLIRDDPRRALEAAVPMVVRQELPPAVVEQLEERVNGRAALRAYQGVGLDNRSPVATVRVAEFAAGQTYEAHVYGRRLENSRWLADASLHGVALDQQLAVHEEPVRTLELGERPDPSKTAVAICPVSGKSSLPAAEVGQPITAETPALEAFGEIVYLCNGAHAVVFKEQLIYAEGGTGGPVGFTGILPAVPTPSIGNVRVLVIPLTFADQNDNPSTESKLYEVLRDVGNHYAEASYGKLTLLTTVTPPVKLPHNEAWYIQKDTSNGGNIDGLGLEHSHARAEARKMGFDDLEYDCVVVRLRGGPRPAGGYGGGDNVWIYGDSVDVTAHEIGHAFGLAHANFWETAGTSTIGAGANQEYGGHWDVMGGIGLPYGHYNVQAKNQIKWLPDAFVTEIIASGLYRIYAQDQPVLEPSHRFALKLRKDSVRTYWGELRGLYTGHATRTWADYGLILGWRFPGAGGSNIQLLDTTPGSPFGKDDSPVSLGRTFSDREAGIHLTAVAVYPATANEPKSIDVMVTLGVFPSNVPPSMSLTASATVVPQNVPVTFTATASDPDGDLLAYSWQHFGDANYRTISPNASALTRSFPNSGSYVVACTVSDMKGGTVTRQLQVTVGNGGGRFTISGRVTLSGAGLGEVLVNANNANAVITDSDGRFTIPNLAAGTYILTARRAGYTFTELFNNSVTVGPGFEGADFEAAAVPQVSIAAATRTTAENTPGAPAVFTLTRTGDASQALTVNLFGPLGTATRNVDYTITPAPTNGAQGFSTLTFPPEQDLLTITISPINDSAAEGPETVSLELGPGSGYILDSLARATVVIDDDDSTLPKVSLAVKEASTVEGSTKPAAVTFQRTGPTGTALAVPYSVGGTAEAGTDFTSLPGVFTIPAGADSAVLELRSVNDSLAESLETVTLQILSTAALLVDPTANSVTLSIVDDDVQVVTVQATDDVATERDLSVPGTAADTATFLVTRAGDTSAPLTVYYAVSGVAGGSGVTALHGVDYEALPGVLVIPAGQSSGAITILPRWDGLGEGPESVTLQLGAGPTNYRLGEPNRASITILDAGDPPYVEVLGAENAVEPSTAGRFRFSLKGSATGSVVVFYTLSGTAVSGVDFNALPGSVTIPGNGVNTVEINVTPINDNVAEELKTITLTISPNASYQVFAPSGAATIWMRDEEQPTVFVDAAVNNYPPSITENGSGASFYLSRLGSTAGSLTVSYTMSGTALNGTDYQAVSGSAVIPAGALGVDVPIRPVNDSLAEGTETIILTLAPGPYGRGAPARLYLTDDEAPAGVVGFGTSSAAWPENSGTVNIPVTLSPAAASPVTVEYLVDTGAKAATTVGGTAPSPLPYWVRCERVGATVVGAVSADGVTWTGVSTQTIAMASTSYQVGLHVCSFNATALSTSVFDNVRVSNLSPGGTQGTRAGVNVGTTALAGSANLVGTTYTVVGAGDNVEGTTDQGYFMYWPINNSANCTLVARVVSQGNTSAGATAGVMIRDGTANNVRRGYMAATPANGFEFHYRTAPAAAEAKVVLVPPRPSWVRLQRSGGVVNASQSYDGAVWSPVGPPLDLVFGPEIFLGLAVSSQTEGTLATAIIDNVTLTPAAGLALEGRTVGFSATQGEHTENAGTYTLTAAGAGANGTSDDCYFAAMPVSGDFTWTARIISLQSAASSPQGGIMLRESMGRRARMVFLGGLPGAAPQLTWRSTTTTVANGAGIDFALNEGLLTFPPGTTTQNIPFTINNDNRPEADEPVTIVLRNPTGARLGSAQFTLAIVDDDSPPALPFVGFASSSSSAVEGSAIVPVAITLSRPASTEVSVAYETVPGTAIAGADYVATNGILTFHAGETVQYLALTLLPEQTVEETETLTLRVFNPVGALLGSTSNQVFTIVDDDKPVVTVESSDLEASEAGDSATVTLRRTGPTDNPLSVNLSRTGTALTGTDYTGIGLSALFPVGAAQVTLTLTPVQDGTVEGRETVIVGVAPGTGYVVGTPASVTLSIADDDRNLVTIEATGPNAMEGGAGGQLTLTRSGSTNTGLTVTLTVTGTATAGTDYTTTPASIGTIAFSPGQSTRLIAINPVNDSVTEGDEAVLVQIASGPYDVGAAGYASVVIHDNDIPPTVFIRSPAAQGVVIAPSNGVEFAVEASDDGSPQPLTYQWSQVYGPGLVSFAQTNAAVTPATFSAPGTYLVRVTARDGQFSVSDQIAVNIGGTSSLPAAEWLSSDIGPTTLRGYSGQTGTGWVLSAAGTGYATDSDRAHAVTRQVTGDGVLQARLGALTGPAAAEAGLSIRDALHRYSRRAVLLYQASTRTLRFRTRLVSNTTDTSVSVAGLTLPVWLKLERNSGTGVVKASYAADAGGTPGTWTVLGTPTAITMDTNADYSLTAHSGSDTVSALATFDNVTLSPTPIPGTPAQLAEDFGGNDQVGSYNYDPSADLHTLMGRGSLDGSGMFRGQQFTGDFILTVLQTNATSGASSARSGIMIRDSMDDGPMAFVGRIPTGSYPSFVWRTNPKGGTGGLNGITSRRRWLRLIRRGNQVTALHAPDNAGVPGAWVQLGQPQTVFLQPTVLAGLYCDNSGGVGLNTANFTKLTVTPLNQAPVIDAGPVPTNATAPLALRGSIVDDGFPTTALAAWTVLSAPGPVNFTDSNAPLTSVNVGVSGDYFLRLWADDGLARSFDDLHFSYGGASFAQWQAVNFAGGAANPNAGPLADPDGDGLHNAAEYGFGSNPNLAGPHPVLVDFVTIDTLQYLRVTMPKNPAATDATLTVEANGEVSTSGWTTDGLIVEQTPETTLQVRDGTPVSSSPRRFLRVNVELR